MATPAPQLSVTPAVPETVAATGVSELRDPTFVMGPLIGWVALSEMLATEISDRLVDKFRQMIPPRFLNFKLVVLLLANIGAPLMFPST